MRQRATATSYIAARLRGPARPALLLGTFPTAAYLQLPDGDVLALLSRDAIQLPIGLTLPLTSAEFSMDRSVAEPVWVGAGAVQLPGLTVTVGEVRSAALIFAGRPRVPAGPSPLFDDPVPAVALLLGRGPGLTPAGDDELCGALAAIPLFGLDGTRLRAAVRKRLEAGPRATTSLSGALLRRAVAGEGLFELQALADALCGSDPNAVAVARSQLLRIGHGSGAALTTGLLAGARHAVTVGRAA